MTKVKMPFGPYEGQPLAVVLKDPSFCYWFVKQGWLKARHPDVFRFIAENLPAKPIRMNAAGSTRFIYARVTNAKLGFIARPECLICGSRPFDVPYGSTQAVFKAGNELMSVFRRKGP